MFDEDVGGNLRTCLQVAPQFCTACGDFHTWWAMRRLVPGSHADDWDDFRKVLTNAFKQALPKQGRLSALVAGAADTGILKAVIDAAYSVGGEALVRRIDYRVADHCRTPLEMCERYGAVHGLNVHTDVADLGRYNPPEKFDVIAMHEVLTFFPTDERADYARRIGGWLKPGGVVVNFALTPGAGGSPDRAQRIAEAFTALDLFLKGDGKDLTVDLDDLRLRAERGGSVRSRFSRPFLKPEDVFAFYADAGMEIVDQEVVTADPDAIPPRRRGTVVVAVRPRR